MLKAIGDLEHKAIEEVEKTLKRKGNDVELNRFPFYVSLSCGDDVVSVRIEKVGFDKDMGIRLYGADTFGYQYDLDLGSDIIGFVGFDLYNSVYQELVELICWQ